jgi:acyl-CoA thioesterase I
MPRQTSPILAASLSFLLFMSAGCLTPGVLSPSDNPGLPDAAAAQTDGGKLVDSGSGASDSGPTPDGASQTDAGHLADAGVPPVDTATLEPTSDGVFQIFNQCENLAVAPAGASTNISANLELQPAEKLARHQLWKIEYLTDGFFTLTSQNNDALVMAISSGNVNTPLNQYTYVEQYANGMGWKVEEGTKGWYRFVPKYDVTKSVVAAGSGKPLQFADRSNSCTEYFRFVPVDELTSTAPVPAAGAPRVMLLGDSITDGDDVRSSFRRPLARLLREAGLGFDFVGPKRVNKFGSLPPFRDFDLDHAGHWGWTVGNVQLYATSWALVSHPDIVLMHLGTNDVAQNRDLQVAADGIADIVNKIRATNANTKFFVAKIIPLGGQEAKVQDYNARLETVLRPLSTAKSPIELVDQFTGFDATSDCYDFTHPNPAGEEKMAKKWFEALRTALQK